ncbi:MAG: Flp family type IVb pilin [Magnetospirillum sp.]|nr:Flp family type IVb pilin [Magnetospirillum sp.]
MFASIRTLMTKFSRDEQGATAIEYGLIAALISIIAIPGMLLVGPKLLAAFNTIATNI